MCLLVCPESDTSAHVTAMGNLKQKSSVLCGAEKLYRALHFIEKNISKVCTNNGTRLLQPQECPGLLPPPLGMAGAHKSNSTGNAARLVSRTSWHPMLWGAPRWCWAPQTGAAGRGCAGWRDSGGHLFLTPSPRKLCPADSKQLTFEDRDKMQLNDEGRSRVSRPHTSGVSLCSFLTQNQVEPK